jgi:hypothetical protein
MKTILIRKIMLMCSLIIIFSTAYAQQFTLQNTAALPGQNVSVSLDITQAIPNAGAITLFFQIDEAVLAFNSATIVMPEASGALVNKYPGQPKVGIVWSAPGISGVDFPVGTMLTVNFSVISCNNSPLAFLISQCEVVDWDVNPIAVSFIDGNVTSTSVATANWTGSVDNDWNNSANWDGGAVPGCNTDVTIASATTYPVIPNNKAFYSINSLSIAEGGALTIDGSLDISSDLNIQSGVTGTGSLIDNGTLTVSGNTSIERYYNTSSAWHLIASPIADGQAGIYTGVYLQKYDEPGLQWIDIIDPADPLIPSMGYALWTNTTGTYSYEGTRNTGFVNIPVTASQPFGWNLLGNPYSSSLDWDLVIAANPDINGAIYYLDATSGNYLSYNGGMGGGSQYVPPMQGFFVSAANAGTFSLENTMRTHAGQNNYYKSDFENLLALKVEGNNYSDVTYLRFDDEATAAFDGQFDAYKLMSGFNSELPQIYTKSSDVNLSINVLPIPDAVPLSFAAGLAGNYTISIDETNGMEYIFLEDLLTGQAIDLLNDDYAFEYSIGDNSDRFLLHFNLLSVDELIDNSVQIYSTDNIVNINFDKEYEGEITVFDVMGRKVEQQSINSLKHELTLTGRTFYVVSVTTDEKSYTKKIYTK